MMQSSPFTWRRVLILAGRFILGLFLIIPGYLKLFYPTLVPHWPVGIGLTYFALQVDSYQLLAPWGVSFVAHTLPFAEIVLGLLLLIGWRLRVWGSLASVIMIGFFAVVWRTYALHLDINCGCFANKSEPLNIWTVVRDGLLAALAVVMTVFAHLETRRPHPWLGPEKR
jgi:uncharacterized membrane protein YphA (DoxX/SURF4 family)